MKRIIIALALLASVVAMPASAKEWEFVVTTSSKNSKLFLWQSARKGKTADSIQIYQRVEYGVKQDTGELSGIFLVEVDCHNKIYGELEMTTFDETNLRGKKYGPVSFSALGIETSREWGSGAEASFLAYACKKFYK